MRLYRNGTASVAVVVLLAALGCSASSEAPAGPAPTDAGAPAVQDGANGPRTARTLPLPDPTGGQDAGRTGSGPLVWSVPAAWTEVPPSSSMRIAQYRAPGSAGDGECVVYYFGPGQGGDPESNAVRWARQFTQPDGRPSVEVMQVTELESASVPVRIVEVTGTYDGGMTMTDAPAEKLDNHMLLGGIAIGPDAPWFFKFTGPEATVREQRQAFLDMMASVRPGA